MPPPRPYPTWVLGGILAATLLVSVGTIAYRAVTSVARAAIAQEPRPSRNAAVDAPLTAPAAAADVLDTPPAVDAAPRSGESIPFSEPLPQPAALAFDAPPAAKPAPSATAAPSAPSRGEPTDAEFHAALVATPIVMYGTSWCGVCRKARQFLSENGLRYQEVDADLAPGGWTKVEQLSGRRAVPVIVVDGEVSAGLAPQRIMNAVARSMERRLGVTGIRFRSN